MNVLLVKWGINEGVEDFDRVRFDATVVDAPIPHPNDSGLLWDSVRVLARGVTRLREVVPELKLHFTDHRRRAKRRHLKIHNATGARERKAPYRDLLKVSRKTVGYAEAAFKAVRSASPAEFTDLREWVKALGIAAELTEFSELCRRVIDQTVEWTLGQGGKPI